MRSLFWIFLGWIFFIIDSTFMQHLRVFNVTLSFVFLTVILVGLFEKKHESLFVALILRLSADAMSGTMFGVQTTTFLLIALVTVTLRRNTISYSVILQMTATFAGTIIMAICTLLFAIYYSLLINYYNYFFHWYIPFAVCNIVCMPIFSYAIKQAHYRLIKYFD